MCDDMFHDRGGGRVGLRPATRCWRAWFLLGMVGLLLCGGGMAQAAESFPTGSLPPPAVRLNLGEAVALFLKQNLDLLDRQIWDRFSRGQQITAKLFPNPVLQIGTVASFTQGNTLSNSGALTAQVQQLFELAGKRGYRIESAGFGMQSAGGRFRGCGSSVRIYDQGCLLSSAGGATPVGAG